MKRTLSIFRKLALAEGISFLVLLLIAMPLKYLAGIPEPVTYVGWAHGALFIAFLSQAFEVRAGLNKGFGWMIKAFFAAILPFGTFIFDKELKKDEAQLRAQSEERRA